MVGMLQVLTYMFAFYLVLKGVEIFQIGLASSRPDREPLIAVGVAALIACGIAAIVFINMQDKQAESLSSGHQASNTPTPIRAIPKLGSFRSAIADAAFHQRIERRLGCLKMETQGGQVGPDHVRIGTPVFIVNA